MRWTSGPPSSGKSAPSLTPPPPVDLPRSARTAPAPTDRDGARRCCRLTVERPMRSARKRAAGWICGGCRRASGLGAGGEVVACLVASPASTDRPSGALMKRRSCSLGRRSGTPRRSQHGGKSACRRHPASISPQNRRRPLPEGRPASTGPRSSGRSARGRPGAGCTRRTAARSQPPSTLDPSRLGLCSEERPHVSRVRGAVIGPDDMEAGRGSEPARTLARPAWSRLWMVGSEQRSSAGFGHQLGLAGAAGRCPA